MVNEFGGRCLMPWAFPRSSCARLPVAVCKINIDSDLRLAMTGTIRKFMAEHLTSSIPRVPEARPRRHQGAGVPQDRGRAGLRPQGLSLPRTLFLKKAEGARCAPPFSVRGQLLFIRGGHLRLRSSTRRAKAAMVQSSTVSPGRITRLKSSWGSRPCAAALSECTGRTPGYGWRDGSGRRCFGRYRNASWQFSFAIGQDSLTARRFNRAWVT